jgi:hypothetical protein
MCTQTAWYSTHAHTTKIRDKIRKPLSFFVLCGYIRLLVPHTTVII